jgi:hypothetical protein
MERLCLRRLTTQKGASRMVVQSSELKSPLDFTIWNPRIPSIYARGPERAEITSFPLALNRFVLVQSPGSVRGLPTISHTRVS